MISPNSHASQNTTLRIYNSHICTQRLHQSRPIRGFTECRQTYRVRSSIQISTRVWSQPGKSYTCNLIPTQSPQVSLEHKIRSHSRASLSQLGNHDNYTVQSALLNLQSSDPLLSPFSTFANLFLNVCDCHITATTCAAISSRQAKRNLLLCVGNHKSIYL